MRSVLLPVILSAAAQAQYDPLLKRGHIIDPKIAQIDYPRNVFSRIC